MKREDKVVSHMIAVALQPSGWSEHTDLSWMRNSEGWQVMTTPDAMGITAIRQGLHLVNGCVPAPDVSELLGALQSAGTVSLTVRQGNAQSELISMPEMPCGDAVTVADALARLWIHLHQTATVSTAPAPMV